MRIGGCWTSRAVYSPRQLNSERRSTAGPSKENVPSIPTMKITGVNVHLLEGRLRRRFGWSLNWTDTRSATLVEVTTDAGLTGWGNGNWAGERLLHHPELLIGRSPFEVEAIFDDLRPEPAHQARVGGASAGGIDVALWDICAKARGRPVCDLLGRRY